MILNEKLHEIKELLILAAKNKNVIRYPEIYGIFAKDEKRNNVWDTFEEACRNIVSGDIAIYSSLMALKNTNIPDIAFYDTYRIKRSTQYTEIAGNILIQKLSLEQKKKMTEDERNIVFQHAKNYL